MIGLFCACKVNTNEDYRKVVKIRMNRMIALFAVGCITLGISLFAKMTQAFSINDQMLGVYTGVGTGLIFAAVVIWIKNKNLLSDEVKLKNSRLLDSDERIQEISNKAFRMASVLLLAALYAVGLIGGLFVPILVEVLFAMVILFALGYIIAFKIYEKRM